MVLLSNSTVAQELIVKLPNGNQVILYHDKTWEHYEMASYNYDFSKLQDNQIPNFLRQGISANKSTLKVAVKMHLQGWAYSMPKPKSSKAGWGYRDGRTTWWYGYWYNKKTKKYSHDIPKKKSNGFYYGDDQNNYGSWRNGGSPSTPSKIQWLLSSSGGVQPY